jgi:hypothetical protein
LYKAFGYGIYGGEQHDDPEKCVPGDGMNFSIAEPETHVANKHGADNIQHHAM